MISSRRIALVSRAPDRHRTLALALRAGGYLVDPMTELEAGPLPDLALVDVSHDDHWATARFLASSPLILLVDDADAMQRGFELGAEDCVLVSAHPDEVVARCDACLRRTRERPRGAPGEVDIYVDRRLWVNFSSHQVWIGQRPVRLTPREFRLLRYLISNRDRTVEHEEILQTVWSRPTEGERPAEVLKQYVWRLRQKIEVDPEDPEIIVTDAGQGYRFVGRTE